MSAPIVVRLRKSAEYCESRHSATVRLIGRECEEAATTIEDLLAALEGQLAVTRSLMRDAYLSDHITAPIDGKRYSAGKCIESSTAAIAKAKGGVQ